MLNLSDKNILVVKNGDHSLISLDGNIIRYDKQEVLYRKRTLIKKMGGRVSKSVKEAVKIGNKAVHYNALSGFWFNQEGETSLRT